MPAINCHWTKSIGIHVSRYAAIIWVCNANPQDATYTKKHSTMRYPYYSDSVDKSPTFSKFQTASPVIIGCVEAGSRNKQRCKAGSKKKTQHSQTNTHWWDEGNSVNERSAGGGGGVWRASWLGVHCSVSGDIDRCAITVRESCVGVGFQVHVALWNSGTWTDRLQVEGRAMRKRSIQSIANSKVDRDLEEIML